jgi:hypothetical protein
LGDNIYTAVHDIQKITANISILQSDGEEPTSPVPAADEVEVSGDAAASSGSMSVLDALKGKHQQYLPTTSIP